MQDQFTKEKSDFLSKKDKSKKGSIDKGMIPLVSIINSKSDFYTTSSCAGRIVLLEMRSKKKNECDWIFAKHGKVTFNEVNSALNKFSMKNNDVKNINETKIHNSRTTAKKPNNAIKYEVWLKQQPLILHVACRNLDAAKRLLETSRKLFKKAGIIGLTERKITVEVIGSEHIETIVMDQNFAADEKYLKELVKHANVKYEENGKKTNLFLSLVKGL
jgi:tRNA wybutosine-synthesizing protein 3